MERVAHVTVCDDAVAGCSTLTSAERSPKTSLERSRAYRQPRMESIGSVTVCDDTVARPARRTHVLTTAERSRLYRQRKREKLQQHKDKAGPPKPPKTSGERCRAYRQRMRQELQQQNNDEAGSPKRPSPDILAERRRSHAYRQRVRHALKSPETSQLYQQRKLLNLQIQNQDENTVILGVQAHFRQIWACQLDRPMKEQGVSK